MSTLGLQIEPARASDAAAVAQIHVDAWRAAYAGIVPDDYLAALSVERHSAMWREAIAQGSPELLVARTDAGLAGWVSFGPSRDEGAAPATGEVWALYVAPAHWAAGGGHRLWQRARERLVQRGFTSAMLWVLGANARAIRFYEAAGFVADADSDKTFTLGSGEVCERRYRIGL